MKNTSEKKGLFERLIGGKKDKKCSCCNFKIEEIPLDTAANKEPDNLKGKNDSCCKK